MSKSLSTSARGPSVCKAFPAAGRSSDLVENLDTTFDRLDLGSNVIPTTLNDGSPTCYVCCPSAAYVDYARFEMRMLGNGAVADFLAAPLLAFGSLLIRAAGLDRQVQLNNWLVATNPPFETDGSTMAAAVASIVERHPDHALYIRSLDRVTGTSLMDALSGSGWILLPARMIYLFDFRPGSSVIQPGRDEYRDRELAERSHYALVEGSDFDDGDFTRAAELYRLLYVEKYTPLNPHYTAAFIENVVRNGVMAMQGLRSPTGILDGVIGFLDADAMTTAPVVGYDTALPQDIGLYRMLMSIAATRARRRGVVFNASAGADSFKRNRGGQATLEWSAAYVAHLPWRRRAATAVLAFLLTRIGVPLLERYVA